MTHITSLHRDFNPQKCSFFVSVAALLQSAWHANKRLKIAGVKWIKKRATERERKKRIPPANLQRTAAAEYYYYYFCPPWELCSVKWRRPIIFDLFSCDWWKRWLFPAALIIRRWWGEFFNLASVSSPGDRYSFSSNLTNASFEPALQSNRFLFFQMCLSKAATY
jgi:hypothetical protein